MHRPEKHTHNLIGVNEQSVNNAKEAETKRALEQDAAQYTSERKVLDTEYSTSTGAVVTGQRTHHHVHHHVQPVIQKETIAPEVVHTVVPVHETHQAEPIHHETTILPVKTMDEFLGGQGKAQGDLKSTATPRKIAEFDGCPGLKDKSLESGKAAAIHGLPQGNTKATSASNNLGQEKTQAKMVGPA